MNARRRLLHGAAGALALGLLPTAARAAAASLLALRLWPSPEYTRVTIEFEPDASGGGPAPLKYRTFTIEEGRTPRFVVDIEGATPVGGFAAQARKLEMTDPFVARVRVGQHAGQTVRLALDLKKAVLAQVFTLEPVGPYRNRLVLDLYPKDAPDPLLALIERSQDQAGLVPPDDPDAHRPPSGAAKGGTAPEGKTDPGADAQTAPRSGTGDTANADSDRRAARPVPRDRRLVTIAIDPGHGGEDPGAIGTRGTREKDIVLSIARLLAAMVEGEPDHRVLLTRDSDYFVSLGARVERARRVQADLFVSIHADAWIRSEARGASVFALSERGATSSAAAELARQQNDSDRIGGLNLAAATPLVRRVLLDLSTTRQISDSLDFGDAVLHELGQVNRLHKGIVEQAGFAVLKAPDIPSILVESAFLSNPEEEARLLDPGYQHQVASAVFQGMKSWLAHNPPVARNPVG